MDLVPLLRPPSATDNRGQWGPRLRFKELLWVTWDVLDPRRLGTPEGRTWGLGVRPGEPLRVRPSRVRREEGGSGRHKGGSCADVAVPAPDLETPPGP